jgi:hypothetical protein
MNQASRLFSALLFVSCSISVAAIFFHITSKRPEFRKSLLNIKSVLISYAILPEKFYIKEKIQRGVIIYVHNS